MSDASPRRAAGGDATTDRAADAVTLFDLILTLTNGGEKLVIKQQDDGRWFVQAGEGWNISNQPYLQRALLELIHLGGAP